MQLTDQSDRFIWFWRLATFVLVVAVLRVGQEVLLPLAFAVLLAFLLSPLVVKLTRRGLPRVLAILATVTIAFSVLGGVGWIVTSQAIALARELPNYEENIRQKITTLKHPHAPAAVQRMAGMVDSLRREMQSAPPATPTSPRATPEPTKPVPVEIRAVEATPWQLAREIVSPVLRTLAVTVMVIVFVVAMLIQREDLRDRFIKLVSAGKLNIATQAIDDAAGRVSRYLGMQLVVNATYGVPVGIALYLIGIPNALLWGLLATLLRFIPFVGPWIGAAFPLTVALAIDPGWSKVFYTLGVFVVMEIITANFTEIILYGASTGISNLALLVAAVFWTWLWGPAGLVLSTPLTVCVLVLGNYVPGMNFLSMLLGSEPVLEPPAQFYQRMLSMESEDMLDLATKYIAEHSLEEFYEQVFVPALLLSEIDRHSGTLAEERQRFIFQSSRELIEELEREEAGGPSPRSNEYLHGDGALPATQTAVIGLPARDEADEIVALALCHLLRRRGLVARVNPLATPLHDVFVALDKRKTQAVFVSALPPSAVGAARQMSRRVKAHAPDATVLVAVWQHHAAFEEVEKRLEPGHPTKVVTTLEDAAEQLAMLVNSARPALDDGTQPSLMPSEKIAPK